MTTIQSCSLWDMVVESAARTCCIADSPFPSPDAMKELQAWIWRHHPPFELATPRGGVQIFIRLPSAYIVKNLTRILPGWQPVDVWVIIVLQQSALPLEQKTPSVAREKDDLRERFLHLGFEVAYALRDRAHLCEVFDPPTGLPLLSRPGDKTHDDVAAVAALLDYPVKAGDCACLVHPRWETAVYPGILMAAASPILIWDCLQERARRYGWTSVSDRLPARGERRSAIA